MKKAIEKLSYIIKQSKIKSLYHRGFLRCKENCNKLIIGVNPVPAAIKHICDTSCSWKKIWKNIKHLYLSFDTKIK